MKRYVIERNIPGIGSKTAEEYRAAAQVSNEALAKLAPRVQWVHSYFAGDMTYCVYLAEDPEQIAMSMWGIAHGLVSLELNGNLPPGVDAEATYELALRAHGRGWLAESGEAAAAKPPRTR